MMRSVMVGVLIALGLVGCVITPVPTVSASVDVGVPGCEAVSSPACVGEEVPPVVYTCYDVYGQVWEVEYPCLSYVGLVVVRPAVILPLPFGYVRPVRPVFSPGFRGHRGFSRPHRR